MNTLPINVCQIETPDGPKQYVTCLSQEVVFQRGLPGAAIIGVLVRPLGAGEAITPDVFARNLAFVEFMHSVIARRDPELPSLIAEAKRQGEGWVYVIDQRTPTPRGAVPPEDILGAFAVKNGQVVPGSYVPSHKHHILSPRGFVCLGAELEACLLEELTKLAGDVKP
jgi:hypothetical protein